MDRWCGMFSTLRGLKRRQPLQEGEFPVISNRSQYGNSRSMVAVGSGQVMPRARAKVRVGTEADVLNFRRCESESPPSEGHLLSLRSKGRGQTTQDSFSRRVSQEDRARGKNIDSCGIIVAFKASKNVLTGFSAEWEGYVSLMAKPQIRPWDCSVDLPITDMLPWRSVMSTFA
jgi:hypothetical protein